MTVDPRHHLDPLGRYQVMKERDDDHEPVKKLVHSVLGQHPEISGLGLRT